MSLSLFTRRGFLGGLLALSIALLATIPAAFADDALATAKAAGQVGERPDGLVAARPGAPAAAAALAAEINAARLARYREIAAGNGATLESVQALAGKELVQRTPVGHYIVTGDGRWVRK